MRIPVTTIPRGGRQVELSLGVDWAVDSARTALDAPPTALSGSVDVAYPDRSRRVDVRCAIEASMRRPCDRCGEDVVVAVRASQLLLYFPVGSETVDRSGEVELGEEDLEVGWYEDGALDLEAVVREAIALEVPPRITCADVTACDARTRAMIAASRDGAPTGHPAFAALRDLS